VARWLPHHGDSAEAVAEGNTAREGGGGVGKKQCDLTSTAAATEVAAEAKLRYLGDEVVSREILELKREKETVQHHDLGVELAPS
jgi:hypothetical protein